MVAIADRDGLVCSEGGLDVDTLLASRNEFGVIDRSALRDSDTTADRDSWLDVPCDLLVPAAMSYVITPADAARVRARVVVEGANMPTLPEAEAALIARGIPVVPDFLANVMTNAWWWWVVFGDIEPTEQAAFAKIDTVMRRLMRTVGDEADASGRSLRECALDLAARNSRAVVERVGVTG